MVGEGGVMGEVGGVWFGVCRSHLHWGPLCCSLKLYCICLGGKWCHPNISSLDNCLFLWHAAGIENLMS